MGNIKPKTYTRSIRVYLTEDTHERLKQMARHGKMKPASLARLMITVGVTIKEKMK